LRPRARRDGDYRWDQAGRETGTACVMARGRPFSPREPALRGFTAGGGDRTRTPPPPATKKRQ
jgi:hypothetical protein